MNFGGFLGSGDNGNGGSRIMADLPYLNHHDEDDGHMPSHLHHSLAKPMFCSPGLSLALVCREQIILRVSFTLRYALYYVGLSIDYEGCSASQQTGAGVLENHGEVNNNNNNIIMGGGGGENSYEGISANKRSREDLQEHESRSGSDNLEGVASGDDQDAADNVNLPARKKRYHRHTPQQIQELEA